MKTLTWLAIVTLIVGGTLVTGKAQTTAPGMRTPARDGMRATGEARIRGRVTAADSALPVSRAQVSAVASETRTTTTTLTDDAGNYEIGALAEGAYSVEVRANGYLPGSYGSGKRVVVGARATVDRTDIILSRGGVISGTVTDVNGAAATGVEVTPLRTRFANGIRRVSRAAASSRTDDRGEFRVFGLTPGNYFLLATPANGPSRAALQRGPNDLVGLAPTYYPGVLATADAQLIQIDGAETKHATISLVPTKLVNIRGVALIDGGGGIRNGIVTARTATGSSIGTSASVSRGGEFTLSALPAGTYYLQAKGAGDVPDGVLLGGTVTLGDEDVSGVVLQPIEMVRVTGRLSFADGNGAAVRPGAIQVGAMTLDGGVTGYSQRPGAVRDDLTFEFYTWPGPGLVRVSSSVPGWSAKTVRLHGRDVSDEAVEFPSAGGLDGLEITLTGRPTAVTGSVTADTVPGGTSYVAIVFAQDSKLWSAASGRHVVVGRPDTSGRFTLRGLPPGAYYAAAIPSTVAEREDMLDPTFLMRIRSVSSQFILTEGEMKSLGLTLMTPRR